MTEENIEKILTDIVSKNADGTEFDGCEVCSFEDAGFLTSDKGIMIDLPDGTSILLTIQGYDTDGTRMN